MIATETQQSEFDPLEIEAADWLVRLTSGEATEAEAREFDEWRTQSPAHDAVVRQLAGMRVLTRALQKDHREVDRRRLLAGGFTASAVAASYGVVHPPLGLWPSFAELTADHRTGPGRRYAFTPTDGVRVEMNSRTSLSLTSRGAGIRLINGEAFVSVTEPRQAFTVEAGPGRMAATAAAFNVQALNDGAHIACVSGAVACSHAGGRSLVRAGEQFVVDRDGRAKRSSIDPAQATAWRAGLLIFKGTPLSEVVEQINLYRSGRIILTDATIGRRPVVGVFHTSQMENAVGQIQQLLNLRLQRLPGGIVLMG